jgi:O-antigen/teichoic acid export membrane protein
MEPGTEDAPFSARALLRRAGGLSGASILASLLALPTTLLAARWLGATDFGRAQFVVLLYSYAGLLRTGAFEGGVRSFVHHRRTGDLDRALKDQNVGFSVDVAASLLPGLALAGAALFADDGLRVLGLALAPLAAVTTTAAAYLAGMHTAREHFGLVARVNVLRAVLLPVLVLGGVVTIGAPAVFVGPILADGASLAVYLVTRSSLSLRWDFDRATAGGLVRTGFPLGALAVVYWAYRLLGSSSVALAESAGLLGIYTFAAAPVTVLTRAISGLQTVIMPGLWGSMAGEGRRWVADGVRLTGLIAVVAGLATNLAQAGFPPLVHLVAGRFATAVPIFEVLALNIILLSVATVPSLVLDSQRVNRQRRHLAIWTGALALNALANIVVLAAGRSVLAVAWNDVWVQLVVVLVIFEAAAPYQRPEWRRRAAYGPVAGALALTGALGLGLHLWGAGGGTNAEILTRLAVRVLVVALVWGVVVARLAPRMARRPA